MTEMCNLPIAGTLPSPSLDHLQLRYYAFDGQSVTINSDPSSITICEGRYRIDLATDQLLAIRWEIVDQSRFFEMGYLQRAVTELAL
jgi:hypothetical protein